MGALESGGVGIGVIEVGELAVAGLLETVLGDFNEEDDEDGEGQEGGLDDELHLLIFDLVLELLRLHLIIMMSRIYAFVQIQLLTNQEYGNGRMEYKWSIMEYKWKDQYENGTDGSLNTKLNTKLNRWVIYTNMSLLLDLFFLPCTILQYIKINTYQRHQSSHACDHLQLQLS